MWLFEPKFFQRDVRIRKIFMSDDIAACSSYWWVISRLFISVDVKVSDIDLDAFILVKYASLFILCYDIT